jgi:hypothetical protein
LKKLALYNLTQYKDEEIKMNIGKVYPPPFITTYNLKETRNCNKSKIHKRNLEKQKTVMWNPINEGRLELNIIDTALEVQKW